MRHWLMLAQLVVWFAVNGAPCPAGDEDAVTELLAVEQLRSVPDWITLEGRTSVPEDARVRDIYDGKPHPVLCVTGVYPRQRQIERLAALFKTDAATAERECGIIDFHLQRQVVLEDGAAETEWVAVDDALFRNVLNHSDGYAPEVIREEFADAALTAPLPWRTAGNWKTQISHPELKKVYQARYQAGQREDLPAGSAEVLLFRYIDFGVEPERSYRYRVRVEVLNHQLAGQPGVPRLKSSAPSAARTPWSNSSEPVSVSAAPPRTAPGPQSKTTP